MQFHYGFVLHVQTAQSHCKTEPSGQRMRLTLEIRHPALYWRTVTRFSRRKQIHHNISKKKIYFWLLPKIKPLFQIMLWSTLMCTIHGIRFDYNNSLVIFLIKNAQVTSTNSQYRKESPKSEIIILKKNKLSLVEANWKALPSPDGPHTKKRQNKTQRKGSELESNHKYK